MDKQIMCSSCGNTTWYENDNYAEWVKREFLFRCSECNRLFFLKTFYCPSCGSKMRNGNFKGVEYLENDFNEWK